MFEPIVSLYRSMYTSPRIAVLLLSIAIAAIAVSICASWFCMLKKAGDKRPWTAYIPVINLFTIFNIVHDVPLLLAVLAAGFLALWLATYSVFVGLLLAVVAVILLFVFCRHIAEAFGMGGGFAFGLLVLPFIFYPLLARSSVKFVGKHSSLEVIRAFMTRTRVINLCCVALMILLIVLQWVPFWTYESAKNGTQTASIQQYVWTPTELTDLSKYLGEETGISGFSVEKIMMTPLFELILFIAGAILCTWKGDRPLTALIPIAMGLLGVLGYLGSSAFSLGSGWSLHFLVCVVLKDLGIVNLLMSWIRPEKRAAKAA